MAGVAEVAVVVAPLRAIRWLVEHGFDLASPGCEVDVLKSQL